MHGQGQSADWACWSVYALEQCVAFVQAACRLLMAHIGICCNVCVQVLANDLNPHSFRYLQENVQLNKVQPSDLWMFSHAPWLRAPRFTVGSLSPPTWRPARPTITKHCRLHRCRRRSRHSTWMARPSSELPAAAHCMMPCSVSCTSTCVKMLAFEHYS